MKSLCKKPLVISLTLLLGLAACATPQQQCIASATADLRTLQAQIKTTESNIARGYALHRQSVPYVRTRICYTPDKRPYYCHRRSHRTIETPVAINIDAERAKLASLKSQLAKAERKAVTGTKTCRQTYPE